MWESPALTLSLSPEDTRLCTSQRCSVPGGDLPEAWIFLWTPTATTLQMGKRQEASCIGHVAMGLGGLGLGSAHSPCCGLRLRVRQPSVQAVSVSPSVQAECCVALALR